MPQRDAAAVDVETIGINAQPIATIKGLAGERLVQLPQADITDRQTMLLQQLRNSGHRPDTHFLRCAASTDETTVRTEWAQTALLGKASIHQQAGRRTVRQLAGVASSDTPPFD